MSSTRGGRPGKKAVATRARILDAAAQEFRAKGYTSTRLSDVAAVANTQAGSLYYHFSSREELVEEMLRVSQERTSGYVRRRVAELPDDADPLDRLRAAARAHLETVLELGDYTAATIRIMAQVPEDIRRRRLHEQGEYGRFWRELLLDGQRAGEVRADLNLSALRMAFLGAMNSTPDWFRPREARLSSVALSELVITLFFEGLASDSRRESALSFEDSVAAVERAEAKVSTEVDPDERASGAKRILDAASEVFAQRGYADTRLLDVAEAAGIRTGSMYHHFSSREDLVVQLVIAGWRRTDRLVRASVEELGPSASAQDQLTAAITAHVLSVLRSTAYTSALVRILGQLPNSVREQTMTPQRAYIEYMKSLTQAAAAEGSVRSDLDPTVVTMLITGAINWSVEWFRADGALNADEYSRQFINLVLEGFSARPVSALTSH